MLKKKERSLFTIINVKKHKAEKTYLCPEGVILPSDYYWRGFAICGVEPFEFFFINSNFVEIEEVPNSYLLESLKNYREGKHKYYVN